MPFAPRLDLRRAGGPLGLRVVFLLALLLVGLGLKQAAAAGGGDDGYAVKRSVSNPAFDRALAAIDRGDFEAALPLLESARRQDLENADVYNLIGFSNRKLGRLDVAAPAYDRALALDPRHRGALAYQGELFLARDQLDRAKANLVRLERICLFGCSEERELEAAIAAYEAAL